MEWVKEKKKYILNIGDLRFYLSKYGEFWKIDLQVKSYGKERKDCIYRPPVNIIFFKDENPVEFATEYLRMHIFNPIKKAD